MVQDNKKIDQNWAFVIDDTACAFEPNRTKEEQEAYDREMDRVLASIDFDNL